ncbi:MAG: alanine racemase [Aquificaceae bacterium]
MGRAILQIDVEAIKHNAKALEEFSKKKLMAVVKANAYGMSAKHITKVLETLNCVDSFAVACLEEGVELREMGIKKDILVLGGVMDDEAKDFLEYKLTPVVSHREHLKALKGLDMKFHVKYDTGMGRLGFVDHTVQDKRIEGLLTHLSCPLDKDFSLWQIKKFKKIMELYPKVKNVHLESSVGVIYKVPFATHIRVGLAIYGERPAPNYPIDLKRAITIKARLISVKHLPAGYPVSYSRTYITDKTKRVGVVAFGYADGLSKALSNVGSLYINGVPVRILGNVTMDMTIVDLDGVKAKVGDWVEIVGPHQSFSELAKLAGTIPYEIMCNISGRVERILVSNLCTPVGEHRL